MYETRNDGPNVTAANRNISFNDAIGSMEYSTKDILFANVPSRMVEGLTVKTDETNLAKVPQYTKQGIKSELENLQTAGRQQLVTPISDKAQAITFKQLATETGSSYSEQDGYAVLTPNAKEPNSSTADSFSTVKAIAAGYSEEDVSSFLSSKGYDQEQIDKIKNDANSIARARDAGYDDDSIREFLAGREVQVESRESKPIESANRWSQVKDNKAVDAVVSNEEMSLEDLVGNLKILSPLSVGAYTRTTAFFGDEEAKQQVEQATLASRQRIIDLAAKDGINLQWSEEYGRFFANTEKGWQPVDEGFFQSLASEKGALAGGIGGAIAGGVAGTFVGGPIGSVIGSIIGAAGGTFAGSSYDYYSAAVDMQEELEAQRMMNHAFNNTELSIITDVAFLGAGKAIKFGGGAAVDGFKRVKDFILDGNSKGAYEQLKKLEFLNDSQAEEIVNQLTRVVGNVPGSKFEEKAIAATAITKPGAEGLVQIAASLDTQTSRAVVKAIDDRAKDLLKAAEELSGDNLGRILKEDLANYATDVKQFYSSVKSAAAQSPRANNFRFNYDQLVIDPVLETLQKNITDPTVLQKFLLQAERVKSFSDSRSFADLLELRQVVNEFKFNKRISKTKDFNALNDVLTKIDGAIDSGADFVMENPKAWKNDYARARQQYAKMKQLERNVMFKALTRGGINEQQVTNSLAKYITSLDGTYNDLVTALPKSMREKVENSVIETLANRYTAGVGGGFRAVHFPMLADDLNKVTFTSNNARRMKEAIGNLSEVFKNDVELARISGGIQIPRFQSFLTTDPVARAKYEIASKAFNKIKSLMPGQAASNLALVNKTAALLENPLNSRAVKDLMEEAAGKVDITDDILKLQQEAARRAASGKDLNAGKVRLYGEGSILKAKGSGPSVTLPVHRIASIDEARSLAERSGVSFTDKKALDQILEFNGYKAVQQGSDAVRLLQKPKVKKLG